MTLITFIILTLIFPFLVTFIVCCIQQYFFGKVYIVSEHNDQWFGVVWPDDVRDIIVCMLIPLLGHLLFIYIFGYSFILVLWKLIINIPNPLKRIFPDND